MVVCSNAMCPAGDWSPAAEVWSAPACYLPSAGRGQLTGAAAAEALLREVSEKKLTADRLWAEIISCSDEACEEVRFFCLTLITRSLYCLYFGLWQLMLPCCFSNAFKEVRPLR